MSINEDRITRAVDALEEEAQYRYERSASFEREGDRTSANLAKRRARELQDLATEIRS